MSFSGNIHDSKPVTETADSGVLANVSSSGTIDLSTKQSPNSTQDHSGYHGAAALIVPTQTIAGPIATAIISSIVHAASVLSAPPETTLQHIAAPDHAPESLVSSALSQNAVVVSSTLFRTINQPMSVPAVTPGLILADLASQMQSQTVVQPIATYVVAPGLESSMPSQTSAQPVPIIYTTTAETMLTMQSIDRDLADLRQFLWSDYFDDVNEVGIAEFEEELRREG